MTYLPTLESVRQHPVPGWYHDAKFGIFIHWGPFAIPAYAPTGRGDINTLIAELGIEAGLANIPYSEWYLNSLRIAGSPVQRYHAEHYGPDYSYFTFAQQFRDQLGQWDPQAWGDLFRDAGARYVVFVTKHADGFLMWPSRTPNYRIAGYHAGRNLVGELTQAVKARGMRMGFYYSSAWDWSFTSKPVRDVAGMFSECGPLDRRYAQYQLDHWHELIDDFEPSVLWGDICYPPGTNLYALFAHFYNRNPEGVVNDRFGQFPRWMLTFMRTPPGRRLMNWAARRALASEGRGPAAPHCDFVTPEFRSFAEIHAQKWETCRGMAGGFGYNRMEQAADYLSLPALIRMLVDIVSKNGNLLLNVGPMADGTIPDVQRRLLSGVGAWLRTCGEAIYGTRPWTRAAGVTACGVPVRFTRKAETLYAFLMDTPAGAEVVLKDVMLPEGGEAFDLATGQALALSREDGDVRLVFPAFQPLPVHVVAFRNALPDP